jgi:hypothetical protein
VGKKEKERKGQRKDSAFLFLFESLSLSLSLFFVSLFSFFCFLFLESSFTKSYCNQINNETLEEEREEKGREEEEKREKEGDRWLAVARQCVRVVQAQCRGSRHATPACSQPWPRGCR